MRLIGSITNIDQALLFSRYLHSIGIESQAETVANKNWESENYGDQAVNIWVVDEDRFKEAMELFDEFKENPASSKFSVQKTPRILQSKELPRAPEEVIEKDRYPEQPQYMVTLYIIIACVIIFIANMLTTPSREFLQLPFPSMAIYTSEVYQGLMYDFPKAYQLIEEFVNAYGVRALQSPQNVPEAGAALLQEFANTPYWHGYYEELVRFLTSREIPAWETGPWFEKIAEGEIWRLFTPCLLHADIFHLLFNMLWIYVLGKQMELRLKPAPFFLFVLITGIFSNTAQYLMAGPNFVGISGVITAMLGFLWMRTRIAPWEGYPFDKSLFNVMGIFIFGLAAIGVASFLSEIYSGTTFGPPIANTAHLSGLALGIVLGRFNLFAWKK